MAQEKITCSSCGGTGIVGSVCEYCGSVIQLSTPIPEMDLSKVEKKTVLGEQYAETISKYQNISEYYGKLAIVSIGQRFGLIDRNGKLAVALEYDNISFLIKSKGLFVIKKRGKYALVNDNCIFLLDFQYDEINIFIYNENKYVLTVKSGVKLALFNIGGKPLTDFKYNRIDAIDSKSLVSIVCGIHNPKGLFEVRNENGLGVIDYNGKEIIPCDCNNRQIDTLIADKFIKVKQCKSVGLFDNDGVNILPCEYYFIKPCCKSEKYILTQRTEKGDTLGLFDLEVKQEVLSCVHSFISESFPNLIISKGGKRGAYNIENKTEILPCIYDEIVIGRNWMKVGLKLSDKDKWGLFKLTGEEIIPCRYDSIEYGDAGELKLYHGKLMGGSLFFTIKMVGDRIVEKSSPKTLNGGLIFLYVFWSLLCLIGAIFFISSFGFFSDIFILLYVLCLLVFPIRCIWWSILALRRYRI